VYLLVNSGVFAYLFFKDGVSAPGLLFSGLTVYGMVDFKKGYPACKGMGTVMETYINEGGLESYV